MKRTYVEGGDCHGVNRGSSREVTFFGSCDCHRAVEAREHLRGGDEDGQRVLHCPVVHQIWAVNPGARHPRTFRVAEHAGYHVLDARVPVAEDDHHAKDGEEPHLHRKEEAAGAGRCNFC